MASHPGSMRLRLRCYVCQSDVKHVEVSRDEFHAGFRVHVECHGETQKGLIGDRQLYDLGFVPVEGTAFRPRTTIRHTLTPAPARAMLCIPLQEDGTT